MTRFDRRNFLAGAAGVALSVGVRPLSATAAAASAASSSRTGPITIGLLGATYSHAAGKLEVLKASPAWKVVGVCDPTTPGRRTAERFGLKLLGRDELFAAADVIAVESDIRDHAEHAILALEAGKHVHLEKPPATNGAEMRRVVALARERNLLLQTGFMWRYHPGFERIFEAVREGWLGDIYMVRGFIGKHLDAARREEWAEFPGGSMFELGSHLIDVTVRLLGEPRRITPILRYHGPQGDSLIDNNVAVLEYDRATAVITNTSLQRVSSPPRSFEVLGANGTATLAPIEPPTLRFDLASPAGPYPKGTHEVALPEYRRYEGDFEDLAAAVRGERALRVGPEEELLVAETILKVSGMP